MQRHRGVRRAGNLCNLNEEIRRSMAKITLQDIIEKYREKHEGSEYFDYCI